jgi:hypothetical protein
MPDRADVPQFLLSYDLNQAIDLSTVDKIGPLQSDDGREDVNGTVLSRDILLKPRVCGRATAFVRPIVRRCLLNAALSRHIASFRGKHLLSGRTQNPSG